MPNEFLAIEQELVHLWWRVPLALTVCLFPFALLNYIYELENPQGHTEDPPPIYTGLVKPTTLPVVA